MDLGKLGLQSLVQSQQAAGLKPAVTVPSMNPVTPAGAPSFFTNGMPMGKLSLQLLTLFPPTGMLGLNLAAAAMPLTAALKAASYGAGLIVALYLGIYVPGPITKVFTTLLTLGPWFLYDCLQILLDADFDKRGFQPPLPIKEIPSGGGKNGNWLLTFPLGSLILATLPAGAMGIVAILRSAVPGLIPSSLNDKLALGTGTSSAALVGMGLLGSFMAMRASSGTVAPGPTAPAVAPSAQSGGSAPGTTTVPSLSSIARTIPTGGGAPAHTSSREAVWFMGILGIVVAGGLSLGLLSSAGGSK